MTAELADSLLPTIAAGEAVAIGAVPGVDAHRATTGGRKPPIADLSLEELRQVVQTLGQPAYRAEQVAGWVYRSTATSFDEMSNVPKTLRAALAERYRFGALDLQTELLSSDGETRKAVLALPDGELIESVLMRYPQRGDGTGAERATVC